MKCKLLLIIVIAIILGAVTAPTVIVNTFDISVTRADECAVVSKKCDSDDINACRLVKDGSANCVNFAIKLPKNKKVTLSKKVVEYDMPVKTAALAPSDFKKERTGNTYTTKYDNNGEDESAPINI